MNIILLVFTIIVQFVSATAAATTTAHLNANSLVVLPINAAQIPLLVKFLYSSRKVLLANVTVLALDEQTLQYCQNSNISVEFDSNLVSISSDMEFKSTEFMKLGILKFTWLLKLLKRGHDVVMTDVDIHLVRNPFECNDQFSSCIGYPFDIEITINQERSILNAELNIGFMRVLPTKYSFELVEAVLAELYKDPTQWDQQVFSTLVWKKACGVYLDDFEKKRTATGIGHSQTVNITDASSSSIQHWLDDPSHTCDGLNLRVLSLFHFPYGGNPRLNQYGRSSAPRLTPLNVFCQH